MKNTNTGLIAKRKDYSVAIKYSDKAIKENLIKFIPKGGNAFEVALPDLISLLAKHVSTDVLAPAIMQNNVIKMIRVKRNLNFTPNIDLPAGQLVNLPFNHMMPIEFAIAEEALGLAIIDDSVKIVNKKEYDAAKLRVGEGITKFSEEQNSALLKQINKEQDLSDQNTS